MGQRGPSPFWGPPRELKSTRTRTELGSGFTYSNEAKLSTVTNLAVQLRRGSSLVFLHFRKTARLLTSAMRSWLGLGSAEASGGYASGLTQRSQDPLIREYIIYTLNYRGLISYYDLRYIFLNYGVIIGFSEP